MMAKESPLAALDDPRLLGVALSELGDPVADRWVPQQLRGAAPAKFANALPFASNQSKLTLVSWHETVSGLDG
jgi:hypothetical protein